MVKGYDEPRGLVRTDDVLAAPVIEVCGSRPWHRLLLEELAAPTCPRQLAAAAYSKRGAAWHTAHDELG